MTSANGVLACAGFSTLSSIILAVRETPATPYPKPRLLDQVREAIRARHYSRETEKAYVHWIKRYIFFHNKRHPVGMGAPEVARFLTSLAIDAQVASSTQNQALNAILFLYRTVLGQELPWLDDVVRAKRPKRLPVVLTREEVRAVLDRLDGSPKLMTLLLYGAGLRLLECAELRVKDVDFARNEITVRSGKGGQGPRHHAARRGPPRAPSRRWVANEWRNVWQLACFGIPAPRSARRTPHCHAHSRPA